MGNVNFNLLKQAAADACRYARFNDSRINNAMIDFYKEGKNSPSIAYAILHDQATKITTQFNIEAMREGDNFIKISKQTSNTLKNMREHNFTEDVLPYVKEFVYKYVKLYPKTAELRQYLIAHNRINMDTVTPKAGWFKKLFAAKYLKNKQ